MINMFNFYKKLLLVGMFILPSFSFVDITPQNLVKPLNCQTLSQKMQQVSDKTTIETIHQINHTLRQCVKSANNQQLLLWINQHGQMYNKFTNLPDDFMIQDEPTESAFYEMAIAYERSGKVNTKLLKNFSPRVKYLAQQLGKSEITLYNQGEGYYHFWYKLQTTVDIFAPYLPEDQAVYLKRLAKETQDAFFMDAGITWQYDELIESLLFWESFIKKYPNSQMLSSAKTHYISSQYYLFFGSDNTLWANDDFTKMYDRENFVSLQKLAKNSNSQVANHAKIYLAFLQMNQAQRDKKYPISKLDEDDRPKENWQIAREQLQQALKPLVNSFDKIDINFDNCIDFFIICNANKTSQMLDK